MSKLEVQGDLLIVTEPIAEFLRCLRQPINQPQLILKRRTQTEDYVQLAEAWEAANTKLGWIV